MHRIVGLLFTAAAAVSIGFFLGILFAAQTVIASPSLESADSDQEVVEQQEAQAVGFVPLSPGYSSAFVSQNAYPTLRRGESYKFEVTVKNTGTENWHKDVVHLGTDRPQDRIPGFLRADLVGDHPSGWFNENRVTWQDDKETAEPGETVTFAFWMSAPYEMAPGVYREYFRVVADHITWMDDLGIFWNVTVTDGPNFTIVSQNPYPATLTAGQSYEFVLVIENASSQTWRGNGRHPLRLGTDRERDRVPGFLRENAQSGQPSGWISHNRVRMEESDVASGGQATFRLWYTVPATMESGTYREYFRPLLEHAGWLDDYGIYWDITVDNVPVRPAAVTLKPEVNRLTVVWSASEGATGYKVRYRPLDQDVLTVVDVAASQTEVTLDLAGGKTYEVGVASVDADGASPFTSAFTHVESPAEAAARIAAAEEVRRVAEERRRAEEEIAPEEPVVTGPPATEEDVTRDWRQFWLTLLVLLGAAGLATAAYYGYEWWAESRRRPQVKVQRPEPKREEPPKPPSGRGTRW